MKALLFSTVGLLIRAVAWLGEHTASRLPLGLLLAAGLVSSNAARRHGYLKGVVSLAAVWLEAGDAAGRCVVRVSRCDTLGQWHVGLLSQGC